MKGGRKSGERSRILSTVSNPVDRSEEDLEWTSGLGPAEVIHGFIRCNYLGAKEQKSVWSGLNRE